MQIRSAAFLAAARWHHRVWAQYKVALYFSHRVLLTGEKEACWLRLDAEAASVAPDCLATVRLNKWRLSCWQVSEEKRGGQFCHGTLRVRAGCMESGIFLRIWLIFMSKGGNRSPCLPTLCAVTLLQRDLFYRIRGSECELHLLGQLKFSPLRNVNGRWIYMPVQENYLFKYQEMYSV